MKPIKLGLVGLNFGQWIIRDLLHPAAARHIRIAAVCDIDRARAEEAGRRLNVPAYLSLDSLLADPGIEAVGLFTGPVGRADLLRRIVLSGRDVMTTKPFEVDPAKGEAVLRLARRRGRIIHLNSPSALLPADLAQIAQWREKYSLGRPVGARADVWADYREKADGSWYDDPRRCPVAPVFRLGIYLINDLVRLFGPVQEVQVSHSRLFTGRPTPDNAQLGLFFGNGALANVSCSFCVADGQAYRNTLVLNFEKGTIYRNTGPAWIATREEGTVDLALVTVGANGKPVVRRKRVDTGWGGYDWPGFQRAIRQGEADGVATPAEVVEGIRVITAMARAEKTGRRERVKTK